MFSSGSDKPLALPFVELHIFRVSVRTGRPAEFGIKYQDCCGNEGLEGDAAVLDMAEQMSVNVACVGYAGGHDEGTA